MYFYMHVYKKSIMHAWIFESTLVRLIILLTLDGVGLK
jgi:hypothetical protein